MRAIIFVNIIVFYKNNYINIEVFYGSK